VLLYHSIGLSGGALMIVSYNKLWHLLIDKKMNKNDLRKASGVSTTTMAKLTKGQSVTTDILLKICKVLDCDFADIMEIDKGDGGNA
jgi:DNA-binding Xre family transcriptional regulator